VKERGKTMRSVTLNSWRKSALGPSQSKEESGVGKRGGVRKRGNDKPKIGPYTPPSEEVYLDFNTAEKSPGKRRGVRRGEVWTRKALGRKL